ncbi:MAG: SDR family NAD(P)-dependent oxidoreductase [Gemmataceae bacterium]
MAKRNGMLMLAAAGVGGWLALRTWRTVRGYDLRGKTVVITGGTRGLGLVLARQVAQEQGHLVICARDREEITTAYEELAARGARVLAIPCDVRDPGQAREMIALAQEQFGQIDVLINNAGTIAVGPLETMTVADFQEAMAINFWACVHTTLAVLPEMRRRGEGRIVNITSIGGKVSMPHLLPYSASKFALVGLSEGLRSELAKDGITVTTVCPGLMRTGSPRNAWFKGQHRAEYAWFAIGDSLFVSSISPERAAREILNACKRGDAEVVLSLPAKCLATFHGLFPGLTSDILGYVNRMLPGPGGIGTRSARGSESESPLAPSWLTKPSDTAAQRNNEMPGHQLANQQRGPRVNT